MFDLTVDAKKKQQLVSGFMNVFGELPQRFFSAPGRTEICGNHTDHQRGCVIAAAVNLDTVAAVRSNCTKYIRIQSKGYPVCQICLDELEPRVQERNSTFALVRGVAARFVQHGCNLKGFDAYCESGVSPGSGLSSSAAFEVLISTICNNMFFESKLSAIEIAQVGQYAENVFFGKPSGLMDQMASSVGGMVYIDFENSKAPEVQKIHFDFSSTNHALCIIDTGASHADLTEEYAAVTKELRELCALFEKQQLCDVPEASFYKEMIKLRRNVGDRAILRAIHVYEENRRVRGMREALNEGDFESFLAYVRDSGLSSWRYLQNVIPAGRTMKQEVALALAVSEKLLKGRGACRVHGGGFAGTIQAFVPSDMLEEFQSGVESMLGEKSCHVLSIRSQGGVEIIQ